jgi:hypothetical protein
MRLYKVFCLALLFFTGLASEPARVAEAIKLNPGNPHYFLFRGKPTVLITSAEHYGAVLNLDFDYIQYLDELARNGLNLTRTFVGGPYVEAPESFKIIDNTLAPAPGRFSCVWARSSIPGYAGGGNKFDLNTWNVAHFARLRNFISQASRRGVTVEINLFTPYYTDRIWQLSPLNSINNVNGIGNVARSDALTLKDAALVAVQDAMVEKIVTELNGFDNIYYEVCNEPYFAGVTAEWEDHITDLVAQTERVLPVRHLISHNISNGSSKVSRLNPTVSILNFHYSRPPNSVALNYGLGKVIGMNETGFDGYADSTYRIQGWDFILAGGGLYNNLDYSFTIKHPNGTSVPRPPTPGGGSPALRHQLKILHDFISSFDFIRMAPQTSVIQGGLPPDATARALAEPGRAYAIYIHHGQRGYDRASHPGSEVKPREAISSEPRQLDLVVRIPTGSYRAEWINTKTGETEKVEDFMTRGSGVKLASPSYTEDIALRIRRN